MLVVVAANTVGPTRGAFGATEHAPGAPTLLTVDDAAAPLAVEGAPQFGWVVNDPDRGEVQTAYETRRQRGADRRAGARPVVWRSGKVRSGQQSYVTPPDLKLRPRPLLHVDGSHLGPRRAGRTVLAARPLRRRARATATGTRSWIRRPGAEQAALEDFSLLRKEFTVTASPVVRARAYMSAGQQYDLRVNGVRVAHGPSFSYPDEQYYQATDITQAGASPARRTLIGVVTHWSTTRARVAPRRCRRFIARITIDHADGTRQVITSDADLAHAPRPWIQGPLRNDEGDFVEHIDGRLEPVGWDSPGFDDQAGHRRAVLGPHPVAPFLHLYAARTSIVEHPVPPVTFTRLGGRRVRRRLRLGDRGHAGGRARTTGVAGRAVTVLGGYLLDPDGHVSTTRGMQQTDMHWDYDERAGAQEFRPFGYLGYRYLEVDGAGEPLTAADVVSRRTPRVDARRERRELRDVEPGHQRGVEPRPPFGAVRVAGAVHRHADAREGRVHGPVRRRR